MQKIVRDGKTIMVFDNIDEMKWHFHSRLCRNSADNLALLMVDIQDVATANKYLKTFNEPYEVKV
jgi:hypothetical protein